MDRSLVLGVCVSMDVLLFLHYSLNKEKKFVQTFSSETEYKQIKAIKQYKNAIKPLTVQKNITV